MTISKRKIEFAVAGLLAVGIAGAAIAQDAAASIAARQKDMHDVQTNQLIVNDAAAKGDMARAKDASTKLNMAFRDVATRFTPGSGGAAGKTRAGPQIWTDATGFKAKIDHAIDLSDKLIVASSGTDPKVAQLAIGEVNALCADCHNTYRGGGGQ
jgi:cytochrome c556